MGESHFKFHTLENEMTVLQIHNINATSLNVYCVINRGAAHDPTPVMGISHLIEHLLFRKTKHFDSQQDIQDYLSKYGIVFNAYTNDRRLNYYYLGPPGMSQFERVLYIVNEMMFHAEITQHSFDTEKNIVLQELFMGLDDPETDLWNRISEHLYKGHPLGGRTIGTEATLSAITMNDVREAYKKVYVPKNITLYITGKIPGWDTDGIIHRCCQMFHTRINTGLTKQVDINKALTKIKKTRHYFINNVFPVAGMTFSHPNLRQSIIVMCFPFPGTVDTDYMDALISILREGGEDKLFNLIREKYGLSYVVSAGYEYYDEGGYIYIKVGVNPRDVKDTLKLLKDFISNKKKVIIHPPELLLYKNKMLKVSDTYKTGDKNVDFHLGNCMQYYKLLSVEEQKNIYKSMTLKELNTYVTNYLNMDNARIYTYGA